MSIQIKFFQDKITAKKVPQIICDCGNYDQTKFGHFVGQTHDHDKEHPYRHKIIKVSYMRCSVCEYCMKLDEFNEMYKKFVKDNKPKK